MESRPQTSRKSSQKPAVQSDSHRKKGAEALERKSDSGLKKKEFGPPLQKSHLALRKTKVPPLTPLHRLKRFKAIRDKNLRTNKAVHPIQMEVVNTTVETTVSFKEVIERTENNFILKETNVENLENVESEIINSKDSIENGHASRNGSQNGLSIHEEPRRSSRIKENLSTECESVTENTVKNIDNEIKTPADNLKRSISRSSSVSSIDPDSQHPTSDDLSLSIKSDSSSEEDINVEDNSTVSLGEEMVIPDVAEEKIIEKVAEKETLTVERRTSVTSTSSFKSAYSSTGNKISGRRPVGGYYPLNRKRKAEDDDTNRWTIGNPEISPRWRFFPSSVSNLWSPQKTPFVFSGSTPLEKYNAADDSMAVNVNEETLKCHLNDPDLFEDAQQCPSKKSRWGCIIM